MSATPNPVPCDRIAKRGLAAERGEEIPNNARYPALLLENALDGANEPAGIHALFARNGWGGAWTWEVFSYHHFHPDAFEALAVARGSATLMLGGPQGQAVEVNAGDAVILPPGYGHKQVKKTEDFAICGAYPAGQENYTTIRESEGYGQNTLATIRDVPPPETDPVYGLPFSEFLKRKERPDGHT